MPRWLTLLVALVILGWLLFLVFGALFAFGRNDDSIYNDIGWALGTFSLLATYLLFPAVLATAVFYAIQGLRRR